MPLRVRDREEAPDPAGPRVLFPNFTDPLLRRRFRSFVGAEQPAIQSRELSISAPGSLAGGPAMDCRCVPRSSWAPNLPLSAPFQELDESRQLILYCYSREVSPPPPDWQDFIDVTGYWFLDRRRTGHRRRHFLLFSKAALRRFTLADSEA